MKKYFFCVVLLISYFYSYPQPDIQWQKSLGGSNGEWAKSIQQTTDGGYIIAGQSFSNDIDVSGNHGSYDYWIVKIDNVGNIKWQNSFGGTGLDQAFYIQQTTDEGFIVAGSTASNDGDITGYIGGDDFWIVKLDSTGSIQWRKILGGTLNEQPRSIKQTTDGGYIIAGYSDSNDSDVTGHHGSNLLYDYWVVKLNRNGEIQWQKSLGGSDNDEANSIDLTSDGGYIVAGLSYSNDGDVSGVHPGFNQPDYWIVKLDSTGMIQWQKSLGGTKFDQANYIQQTIDGGYIVTGISVSQDGQVTGNHSSQDIWIVKLFNSGAIQWQKSLGGSKSENTSSINQTSDGGFLVSGTSSSNDGDVTGHHGMTTTLDCWVIRLNESGGILWQKSLGGTKYEIAYSLDLTNDAGFIIAGSTDSNDGDVTENKGSSDYWIVKFSSLVNVNEIPNSISNFRIFPNPAIYQTSISFNILTNQKVKIEIFDLEGKFIKEFIVPNHNFNTWNLIWDITNNYGKKVEDGIYFLTISTDTKKETRKIVVLKN